MGFDDNGPNTPSQSMKGVHGRDVTGGSFPAEIFADVMKAAHQGVKVAPLFTASPDDLDLQAPVPSTVPPAPTSSTSSSTTSSTTVAPDGSTTTTFVPPGQRTTTTSPPPQTTSTTRP